MSDKKVYVVFNHDYNRIIGVYEEQYDAYATALRHKYIEPENFLDLQAELHDGNFSELDDAFEEMDCYVQVHEATLK